MRQVARAEPKMLKPCNSVEHQMAEVRLRLPLKTLLAYDSKVHQVSTMIQ